jgi:hypothetical protein
MSDHREEKKEENEDLSFLDRLFGSLENEEDNDEPNPFDNDDDPRLFDDEKEPNPFDEDDEIEDDDDPNPFDEQPSPIIGPIPRVPIPNLVPDYDSDPSTEEVESSSDDQDEGEGMVFGRVFPYRRQNLPVPEATEERESHPVTIMCRICHHNMINTVTFPCHHAAMCVSCARDYGRVQNVCPVCRTQLQSIDRIYITFSEYVPPEPVEHTEQPEPSNKRRRIE